MQPGSATRARKNRPPTAALRDPLTGLFNRFGLERHLEQLTASEGLSAFALLVAHTDGLDEVSDAFGQEYAEAVVAQLATRLSLIAGRPELTARLAEDEFAVVLPQVDLPAARALAQKTEALLEQPAFVDGNPLEVLVHAGIAIYPEHGDVAGVLRRAGVAASRATDTGQAVQVYQPESDQYSAAVVRISAELRRAIERRQLTLYYQPQVALDGGRVLGVEALLRWNHPERGLIAPDRFIRIAEQSRLIRRLDAWVLEAAVAQAARWRRAGQPLRTAVNLSMRDLQDPQLAASVGELLALHGLPGGDIAVEVTETAVMSKPAQTLEAVRQLAELGVGISIDDFGTGYSSLSQLASLPASEIKIDQGFIKGMLDERSDGVIVRSVIELGHALGLAVTAEGVENRDTWHALADMGCDSAQGFYVAPPLPAAELLPWLARWAAG